MALIASGLFCGELAVRSFAQPPAQPPAATTIALSGFSGTGSIDLVSTAGRAPVVEVTGGADPFFAWSPDGGRLVVSREEGSVCQGCSELYIVGAGGGGGRALTRSGTNANPAWSPSGRLIAFDHCRNVARGPCAIFSIEAGGQGLRRLSPWGAGEGPPVWSHDSRRIAFAGVAKLGIYVMDADGRHLRRLTRSLDDDPSFSPDGARIVFTRAIRIGHMESRDDIFVIRPDGTGQRRLTDTGRENFDPAFSPNGHEIAFVGAQANPAACAGEEAIYEMSPTGSGRLRLSGYGRFEKPTWSPEEAQIAFLGEEPVACPPAEGATHLYVMSARGTGERQLGALTPQAAGGLAWRPAI